MITIYTDGSARGNPGPGGWGTIIIGTHKVVELGGREAHTTNNRMELRATIEGLLFTQKNGKGNPVHIKTDSQYVLKGMTEWIIGWQKRNWIGSNKKEVLNRDLWEALLAASEGQKVTYEYVRGHIGIAGNERADTIATTFADNIAMELFVGDVNVYPIKE
ncbi:MAG: ribonuclease [Candidatus Parcubacteria bacterium]|jgi:ribonuclease HI